LPYISIETTRPLSGGIWGPLWIPHIPADIRAFFGCGRQGVRFVCFGGIAGFYMGKRKRRGDFSMVGDSLANVEAFFGWVWIAAARQFRGFCLRCTPCRTYRSKQRGPCPGGYGVPFGFPISPRTSAHFFGCGGKEYGSFVLRNCRLFYGKRKRRGGFFRLLGIHWLTWGHDLAGL
jgi:hypothetical protein